MTTLLYLVLAVVVVSAVLSVIELIKGFIKKVAKAPGKGIAKLVNYFKNRKELKEQAKLDKALMEADKEARLLAARQNPNYKNHPKVAKIIARRNYKASKRK